MDVQFLAPAFGAGDVVSVHMDLTRTGEGAGREVRLRWQALRTQLEADGASAAALDSIQPLMTEPTGVVGRHGRTIVATGQAILLDQLLASPPIDSAQYGPLPALMPLVRSMAEQVAHAVVQVDHRGALVTVTGQEGTDVGSEEVDGGHDVLHKFKGGGWSHRRFQMRVEDSWERNAETVARELDRVLSIHQLQVIVVAGDPHAKGYLRRHLSSRVESIVVDVEGAGRADGASEDALYDSVQRVLAETRLTHMGLVLARFAEQDGKGHASNGWADTVDALRSGAVDTLLLEDDPSSTLHLWAGPDPLQIGHTRDEVLDLGAEDAFVDRADTVMLRALVAQAASIELVSGEHLLKHGIGAIRRFDTRPPVPGR